MQKQAKDNKPKKPLNDYARYSGMAVQMITIILVGVLGGIKLDEYLSLSIPVFTLALTLLSVFTAIWYFIRDFLKK